jgi:hypothetical protein
VKRLGSHNAKGSGSASKLGADREDEMMDDALAEVTAEELREFLEADALDVPADPAFKEQLRRQLWEIVRSRARPQPPGSGGSG